MSTFNEYSRYYNLFYRDKNYDLEVEYIDRLIKKNNPLAKTILDLGCGTGVHDNVLTKKGYEITGVDLSENMVKEANRNANETLAFLHGDIRKIRLNRNFDVVISLFHVMSYQINYDDLLNSFKTAKQHLNPLGLFIFDFWFGPAVLANLPQQKTKTAEDEHVTILRKTNPELNLQKSNIVNVNFDFEVMEKTVPSVKHRFHELHIMRYWFYPELEFFLTEKTGFFSLLSLKSGSQGEKPDINSWNGCDDCQIE